MSLILFWLVETGCAGLVCHTTVGTHLTVQYWRKQLNHYLYTKDHFSVSALLNTRRCLLDV